MKTDISHLPSPKQRELDRVVQILHEEFGDIIVHAAGKRKAGRILKVILFGSRNWAKWSALFVRRRSPA
ncbi:hypothetical protein [Sphingobium sp. AP50]|uniref:hypothetical protein n=1 Tax=Sphingobium sp. AP50 TaxID=1884369 RepID=UPI000A83A7C8